MSRNAREPVLVEASRSGTRLSQRDVLDVARVELESQPNWSFDPNNPEGEPVPLDAEAEATATPSPSASPSSEAAEDPHVGAEVANVLLLREFELLIEEVRRRLGEDALAPVREAFDLALSCHEGQMRKSGDPYLVHPLRVSRTLAGMGLDVSSVVAGILHDTVEDSELTVLELEEAFGREVALLVDGVTKLGKVPYLSRRENQAESFRKMLVAMSRDIRVLLVKLCDRLDNMRTLEAMPANKQRRIARETADIYAPLARLLGIDWLRRELADLSFRYLEPVAAQTIRKEMVGLLTEDPTHIDRGIELLQDAFEGRSLAGEGDGEAAPQVSGGGEAEPFHVLIAPPPVWDGETFGGVRFRATVLTPQEVYDQRERGRNIETLRDMVTYQVITEGRGACYLALGHVHGNFKPIPGQIRDYVAIPRANRYQGLHTQVLDRAGVRLHVEIRSKAMDAVAERGVLEQLEHGLQASELGWLREMMGWQEQVEDPTEFIEAVKRELFADQVFVFTPEGDLKTFAKGATPIDFAFAVHTDLGLQAAGARVNGQVVPLRYKLRQGDTVEVITDPRVEPREEWLGLVQTSRARARIKHYLRQRGRSLAIETGRQLLRQRLEQRGRDLDEFVALGIIGSSLEPLGISPERGVDRLYELIGDNELRLGDVVAIIDPESASPSESMLGRLLRKTFRRKGERTARSVGEGEAGKPLQISATNLESGLIVLSPCCSPLPGDPVVGFRVPGRGGIETHVEGCPVAVERAIHERIFLNWSSALLLERPVTVRVRTANTVGLLAEMSRAFSEHELNIKQANCRAYDDGKSALNTFHATVDSLARLEALLEHLRGIPGVTSVERVFEGAKATKG